MLLDGRVITRMPPKIPRIVKRIKEYARQSRITDESFVEMRIAAPAHDR